MSRFAGGPQDTFDKLLDPAAAEWVYTNFLSSLVQNNFAITAGHGDDQECRQQRQLHLERFQQCGVIWCDDIRYQPDCRERGAARRFGPERLKRPWTCRRSSTARSTP